MASRLPADLRALRSAYGFNSANVLTLTNPKVLKSDGVAPTAVLHLLPKYRGSCPAAGSCAALCLNTAGNPAYLSGKLARRRLRSDAFAEHPAAFARLLVLEVCRFVAKHPGADLLGLRLNGTSDFLWERVPVVICPDLAAFCLAQFGVRLLVGRFTSLLQPLTAALPQLCPYDYSKRTDRDWEAAAAFRYHLTLSHGSTADTLAEAVARGLNYAAAFPIKRGQPLPATVAVGGVLLPVVDGDVTDWRPGDPSDGSHVVGLRIKRTPGQTEAQRAAFCLSCG